MPDDSLQETLLRVRRLLLDLERHLDRAAEAGDVSEAARAWVRSAHVESALRAVTPPEARALAQVDEGPDTGAAGRSAPPPGA